MIENKLISVLIPCYNCERTIGDSLKSIMNQTYRNLEIICIDDGSTDSTWAILQDLASLDSRIVLLRNNSNLGLIDTLNKGVKYANGYYIARMDSDDISLDNRIIDEVNFMESHNIDICGSYMYLMRDDNTLFRKKTYPYSPDFIKIYALFDTPLFHPTILAKANVYKKLMYIKSETTYVIEDYDLWCRALEQNYKISVCPKYLLDYRYNENGESFSKRKIQKLNFVNRSMMYQKEMGYEYFDYYTTSILCGYYMENRDYLLDLKRAILQMDILKDSVNNKKAFLDWKHKKIIGCLFKTLRKDVSIKNIFLSLNILVKCDFFYSIHTALSYFVDFIKRK